MSQAPTSDLDQAVRLQLQQILGDPSVRQSLIGGMAFTSEDRDKLDALNSQVGALMQDSSLGGVMNGPLWLSGASVVNGTITAGKISVNSLDAITVNSGTINATGDITAAASFPAVGAKIVLNSSGLWGYQSDAVTTTFRLNVDGSGEIGSTIGSKITWTNLGAVSIPSAIISSLTIASVGSGVLGGTYQSGAGSTRFELNTSYIRALAAGTETFRVDAATGAMTATGSFTIKSASTGARVEISNAGGVEGKNASSTSTFLLNATDGSGRLGISGGGLSWNSSGTVSVDGSLLVAGTVTAGKLSVSNLAAINANLGTVTAGTINASLLTVSNLTATNITSGTLGSGASGINIGGTNGIGVTGTLTVADTSAGALTSALTRWQVSGTTIGAVYADSSTVYFQGATGKNGYFAGRNGTTFVSLSTSWTAGIGGSAVLELQQTNNAILGYGRIYPGNGGSSQTTGYMAWDGTNVQIAGANLYVTNYIKIAQSSSSASGALPSPTKSLAFKDSGGNTVFVPAYSNNAGWTA